MLDGKHLTSLVREHEKSENVATILSCVLDNPFGCGRIIRDSAGDLFVSLSRKMVLRKHLLFLRLILCLTLSMLKFSAQSIRKD